MVAWLYKEEKITKSQYRMLWRGIKSWYEKAKECDEVKKWQLTPFGFVIKGRRSPKVYLANAQKEPELVQKGKASWVEEGFTKEPLAQMEQYLKGFRKKKQNTIQRLGLAFLLFFLIWFGKETLPHKIESPIRGGKQQIQKETVVKEKKHAKEKKKESITGEKLASPSLVKDYVELSLLYYLRVGDGNRAYAYTKNMEEGKEKQAIQAVFQSLNGQQSLSTHSFIEATETLMSLFSEEKEKILVMESIIELYLRRGGETEYKKAGQLLKDWKEEVPKEYKEHWEWLEAEINAYLGA